MGHSTGSGRRGAQTAASAVDRYLNRAAGLNSMTDLNNLVEEAANDDSLTNQEYTQIYGELVRRIQSGEQTRKAVPASAVMISDTQYIGAHGRAPRGTGVWFFRIGNEEVQFSGSYTEAKKKAKQEAGRRGYYSASLLS